MQPGTEPQQVCVADILAQEEISAEEFWYVLQFVQDFDPANPPETITQKVYAELAKPQLKMDAVLWLTWHKPVLHELRGGKRVSFLYIAALFTGDLQAFKGSATTDC